MCESLTAERAATAAAGAVEARLERRRSGAMGVLAALQRARAATAKEEGARAVECALVEVNDAGRSAEEARQALEQRVSIATGLIDDLRRECLDRGGEVLSSWCAVSQVTSRRLVQ